MTLVQSLILGTVQAVTEFLPVSSDGHLNLVQILLQLKPSLDLDIFLNTATLLSVLVFFWKDRLRFIKDLPLIIIGSVPAGIIGVLFKDSVEKYTQSPYLLPYFFFYTALVVYLTRFLKVRDQKLDWKKAFIIGSFQALAILPGVSRSASTMFSGLLLGLSPATAFTYSFFLFIPASAGALLLSLKDSGFTALLNPGLLPAFALTAVLGFFMLFLLRNIVKKNHFWIFSVYTFALSLVLFLLFNIIHPPQIMALFF